MSRQIRKHTAIETWRSRREYARAMRKLLRRDPADVAAEAENDALLAACLERRAAIASAKLRRAA